MKPDLSLPPVLSMRRRLSILKIACIILFFSFDNAGVVTNAFQSSKIQFRHLVSDSCLKSTEQGLSELELLQRSLYQKEFDNLRHKSTWLDSMKQLPFDCTGCGNCCKTTGNVYMSPQEVAVAAAYKNMTTTEFIDSYADYKLEATTTETSNSAVSAGGGDVPWILLQNREPETGEGPAACVFLDRETNMCGIYSVRPIQCSTYPFWTNILESEQKWNEEVRRKDSVDDEIDVNMNKQQNLPEWTPDGGGCEGMKLLDKSETELSNGAESKGVSVDEALQQLSLYKRADRRLPRTYNKISVR